MQTRGAYTAHRFPVSGLSHPGILQETDTGFEGFCVNCDEAGRQWLNGLK